jgi:hypothetical protein
MAVAIREQRLLSLTYARAIEPQLFAPVRLYVSASNTLIVEGYEVRGETVRWRELELTQVRDVRQTLRSFSLDTATPAKTIPSAPSHSTGERTGNLISPAPVAPLPRPNGLGLGA